MKLIEKINEILTVRENGIAYNNIEDWDFDIFEGLYADEMNEQERKDIEYLIGVLSKIKDELPPNAQPSSQIEKGSQQSKGRVILCCTNCDGMPSCWEKNDGPNTNCQLFKQDREV